jgi:hypothetical protein
MMQGIAPAALAGKVVGAFKDSVHEAAVRVVRGTLLVSRGATALDAPSRGDGGGSSGGGSSGGGSSGGGSSGGGALTLASGSLLEGSYQQMVRQLPPEHLRPCLQQLLELVFEIMGSYQLMCEFHGASIKQKRESCEGPTAAAAAGGGAAGDGRAGGEGGAGDGEADEVADVQAAMAGVFTAVAEALQGARAEVADAIGTKVKELLAAPRMTKGGDEVVQVGGGKRNVGRGEGVWLQQPGWVLNVSADPS